MLGATVMPHVIYLHSALVQPRLHSLAQDQSGSAGARKRAVKLSAPSGCRASRIRRRYLRFELVDVFVAMNGAWLINSAMIVVAAVAFTHLGSPVTDVEKRLPDAWAAAWAGGRDGLRRGAAMLRPVELDGWGYGGAGHH